MKKEICVVEIIDGQFFPTVRVFPNDKEGRKLAKKYFRNCLLDKEYISKSEIAEAVKEKWYSTSNCYELYMVEGE